MYVLFIFSLLRSAGYRKFFGSVVDCQKVQLMARCFYQLVQLMDCPLTVLEPVGGVLLGKQNKCFKRNRQYIKSFVVTIKLDLS